MVHKWIAECDKTLSMLVWLKNEVVSHDHIVLLKCTICSLFKAKLNSVRSYFIQSTRNIHTSAFKDHATTDIHSPLGCFRCCAALME